MSLVRKNWATGLNPEDYPFGYSPALHYVFGLLAGGGLMGVEGEYEGRIPLGARMKDSAAKNRFEIVFFGNSETNLTVCTNGDMTTNSIDVKFVDDGKTLRVNFRTDRGELVNIDCAWPDTTWPNCPGNWHMVSIMVGRRFAGFECQVTIDADRNKQNYGYNSLHGVNIADATVVAHQAHFLSIVPYFDSMFNPYIRAFQLMEYRYRLGAIPDSLEPPIALANGLVQAVAEWPSYTTIIEKLQGIAAENAVWLAACSGYCYAQGFPDGDDIHSRFKYKRFKDELSWERPDYVKRVTAWFISRGGHGTGARKGATYISDSRGEEGAYGHYYTRMLSEKRATIVIPTIDTVKKDLYQKEPFEPDFNRDWLPYIKEHGKPTHDGEPIYNAHIRFGSSKPYSKFYNRSQCDHDARIGRGDEDESNRPDGSNGGITYKKQRKMALEGCFGAGMPGTAGYRHTWTDKDVKLHTDTFAGSPPGPAAVIFHYQF